MTACDKCSCQESCYDCDCVNNCECACHEYCYCDCHEFVEGVNTKNYRKEFKIYNESDIHDGVRRVLRGRLHAADLYLGILEAIDRGDGDPKTLVRAALRAERKAFCNYEYEMY